MILMSNPGLARQHLLSLVPRPFSHAENGLGTRLARLPGVEVHCSSYVHSILFLHRHLVVSRASPWPTLIPHDSVLTGIYKGGNKAGQEQDSYRNRLSSKL